MTPETRSVDGGSVVNILRDRAVTREQDDGGERKLPPDMHGNDRPHRQIRQSQPHVTRSMNQSGEPEHPIEYAVRRVEDPQPRNGSDRDRRHPRQKNKEPNQSLAAK